MWFWFHQRLWLFYFHSSSIMSSSNTTTSYTSSNCSSTSMLLQSICNLLKSIRNSNLMWTRSLLFKDLNYKNYKGLVHPKNENDIIIYSPWCRSKPVRPLFIIRTQIKIFLMISERPSHRQQGSLHDQGPEKYQDDQQSSPCGISLSTVILWSQTMAFLGQIMFC